MSIEALRGKLPDYAKDLKLNLSSVFNTPNLTPQQAWGTAVAAALAIAPAVRGPPLQPLSPKTNKGPHVEPARRHFHRT